MNRIKTGIPGLDAITDGGFIEGSVNLLTGGTGTGKTIFGSQFIWQGLQMGEPCVYITLEESPEDFLEYAPLMRDATVNGIDVITLVREMRALAEKLSLGGKVRSSVRMD